MDIVSTDANNIVSEENNDNQQLSPAIIIPDIGSIELDPRIFQLLHLRDVVANPSSIRRPLAVPLHEIKTIRDAIVYAASLEIPSEQVFHIVMLGLAALNQPPNETNFGLIGRIMFPHATPTEIIGRLNSMTSALCEQYTRQYSEFRQKGPSAFREIEYERRLTIAKTDGEETGSSSLATIGTPQHSIETLLAPDTAGNHSENHSEEVHIREPPNTPSSQLTPAQGTNEPAHSAPFTNSIEQLIASTEPTDHRGQPEAHSSPANELDGILPVRPIPAISPIIDVVGMTPPSGSPAPSAFINFNDYPDNDFGYPGDDEGDVGNGDQDLHHATENDEANVVPSPKTPAFGSENSAPLSTVPTPTTASGSPVSAAAEQGSVIFGRATIKIEPQEVEEGAEEGGQDQIQEGLAGSYLSSVKAETALAGNSHIKTEAGAEEEETQALAEPRGLDDERGVEMGNDDQIDVKPVIVQTRTRVPKRKRTPPSPPPPRTLYERKAKKVKIEVSDDEEEEEEEEDPDLLIYEPCSLNEKGYCMGHLCTAKKVKWVGCDNSGCDQYYHNFCLYGANRGYGNRDFHCCGQEQVNLAKKAKRGEVYRAYQNKHKK